MHWLSIETSSSHVSLAVGEDATCHREIAREGNASVLIEPLYRELQPDFKIIDQCMIGQGPGSYNGLRVGYAFLKGLLCLNPISVCEVPVSLTLALEVARKESFKDAKILVVNNARREELYGALVDIKEGLPTLAWENVTSEKTIAESLTRKLDAVISYEFSREQLPLIEANHWISIYPTAKGNALAAHKLKLPIKEKLSELEPHYVRVAVPKSVKA
jgi:tRNA threonylcarbamoyl adenosine modification protein YeaZ